MDYERLPAEYAMEIASAARALTSFIELTAGAAVGQDPAYTMSFSYKADTAIIPRDDRYKDLFAGKASTGKLLYSQATEFQKAGAHLLLRMIEAQEMEIKAGMRK